MKASRRGDNDDGDEVAATVAEEGTTAAVTGAGDAPASAVAAKKRLLPMELRRRRRAAKLLIPPPSKANSTPSVQDQPTSTAEEASAQQQETRRDDREGALKRSATEELDVNVSKGAAVIADKDDNEDADVMTELPLSRSVSSSSSVLPTPGSAEAPEAADAHTDGRAVEISYRENSSRSDTEGEGHHPHIVPTAISPTKLSYPEEIHEELRGRAFEVRDGKTSFTAQNEIRWHQALRYFAHPATPLPASITLNRMVVATKSDPKAGGKSELLRDELEFYATRLRQWQDAFHDVYFGFRGLQSSERNSFYVKSNDCTVCFFQETARSGAKPEYNEARNLPLLEICRKLREHTTSLGSQPDESENGGNRKRKPKTKLCAVMSQSTARVRKALHRLNIEYVTPYSSASSTQRDIGQFHLLEEELTAMESQARTAAASSRAPLPLQQNVHGADSLLYFTGHQAVHGLYEFLINRKPLTKEDVPEIYALHPFKNAAIKSLNVKYMGHVAAGLTINEESGGTMFRTEISGFWFPSSLSEVLEILRDEFLRNHSQRQEPIPRSRLYQPQPDETLSASAKAVSGIAIRAYMEQLPLIERFNSLHLSQGAIRKKTVSSTTLEEREIWKHELELSKRRIESVIVRDSSESDENHALFEVETTARTL